MKKSVHVSLLLSRRIIDRIFTNSWRRNKAANHDIFTEAVIKAPLHSAPASPGPLGNLDQQLSSIPLLAIEGSDDLVRIVLAAHVDKPKAARFAGGALDDADLKGQGVKRGVWLSLPL